MKAKILSVMMITASVSVLLTAVVVSLLFLEDGWDALGLILGAAGAALVFSLIFALVQSRKLTDFLVGRINAMTAGTGTDPEGFPELEPLQKNFNRLEGRRREMFSDFSHELKTPLTTICGYAEMMEHGMVPQEDVAMIAGKMNEETRRLLTLIDHVMESSVSRKTPCNSGYLDLRDIVGDVVRSMEVIAGQKNIELKVSGESCPLHCDKDYCVQICYNLLENAIKYTRPGGHVAVTVETAANGGRFIVSDDGVGISSQYHDRIFERFFRVDPSRGREIEGNGLGLSIVKNYVDELGGSIHLESEIGRGTRVVVELPDCSPA